MSIHIYLVRHGRTAWNVLGRLQGGLHTALDEMGLAEADAVAQRLSRVQVDYLYTSDLERCLQTAAAIGETVGCEPVLCKELREISYGDWEGLTHHDIQQRYPLEYEEFRTRRSEFRVPGGETYDEVRRRMSRFLREVVFRHQSEHCGIVMVSHGAAIRILIADTLAMPLSAADRLRIDNASLQVLEYRHDAVNPFSVVSINDSSHCVAVLSR